MRIIDKTHIHLMTQSDIDGKLGHTEHMGKEHTTERTWCDMLIISSFYLLQ